MDGGLFAVGLLAKLLERVFDPSEGDPSYALCRLLSFLFSR
jgi:hypothetical protein